MLLKVTKKRLPESARHAALVDYTHPSSFSFHSFVHWSHRSFFFGFFFLFFLRFLSSAITAFLFFFLFHSSSSPSLSISPISDLFYYILVSFPLLLNLTSHIVFFPLFLVVFACLLYLLCWLISLLFDGPFFFPLSIFLFSFGIFVVFFYHQWLLISYLFISLSTVRAPANTLKYVWCI